MGKPIVKECQAQHVSTQTALNYASIFYGIACVIQAILLSVGTLSDRIQMTSNLMALGLILSYIDRLHA